MQDNFSWGNFFNIITVMHMAFIDNIILADKY